MQRRKGGLPIDTRRSTYSFVENEFGGVVFVFVGVMGYIFFNEIPSNSVVLGGTLIIISGIYVAYRERKNNI